MRSLWRSRLFFAGAALFVLGTGPLLAVIALAGLGLTKDPNPNPIGFGLLAAITFWPSLVLMVLGIVTTARQRRWERGASAKGKDESDGR